MSKFILVNDSIVNINCIKRISKTEQYINGAANCYPDYYIKVEYLDEDHEDIIIFSIKESRDIVFNEIRDIIMGEVI